MPRPDISLFHSLWLSLCRGAWRFSKNFRVGLLACFLALGSGPMLAQSDAHEARIKAAFVFNFLKFAEWPDKTQGATLTLCLVNADHVLEDAFAPIRGRVASERTVHVRTLTDVGEAKGCNVVYINDGVAKVVLDQLLGRHKTGLLTVGDAIDFVDAGGIIGLVEHNGRLQFEINLEAARRSNVQLSSQLLKLARNRP